MGTFRIMWENLWDVGTCLYSSQASADYAAANTQIRWPTRRWQTANGQIAAQNIRQDFGVPLTAMCFIAWSHNYSGNSGSELRIEANDVDAWGLPAFSDPMAWNFHHIVHFFSAQTQTCWRHYINDPANPDNYIRLGRCFLGTYIELQWRPARLIPACVDPSRLTFSKGGQAAADRIDPYEARAWDLQVTNAERLLLKEMFDEVGHSLPFFVCEDSADPNGSTYYVKLVSDRLTFDPVAGQDAFRVRFEVEDER